MKRSHLCLSLVALVLSQSVYAQVCQNVNNAPSTVNYDLSTTLTATQNRAGETVPLVKSQGRNIQVTCPNDSGTWHRTLRSYVSQYPVVETDGHWKYLKLDASYLEAAMRIDNAAVGDIYPPQKYVPMTNDDAGKGASFAIRDTNLTFQLKIVKPFIGSVTIAPKTLFSVYVTTLPGDPLTNVVYNIAYSGTVTVPQSCEINAGQTILVNFGSLYSGNFTHAGEKPTGVRSRIFNVPVTCSGVDSTVNLSLSVQATADAHFTQAIASDNPDVGVVVESREGTVLTPNDASSAVPFVTDEAGRATMTLQAYPVSTTGEVPAEGTFTALANLRVDFD
ncbi:MAG: fimbrial protein [Kluyvera sp.]|uniref:fimbrial protein n=1 Tax=Kluyvera sp. TaxID=1538228 RepID=UPI003F315132